MVELKKKKSKVDSQQKKMDKGWKGKSRAGIQELNKIWGSLEEHREWLAYKFFCQILQSWYLLNLSKEKMLTVWFPIPMKNRWLLHYYMKKYDLSFIILIIILYTLYLSCFQQIQDCRVWVFFPFREISRMFLPPFFP